MKVFAFAEEPYEREIGGEPVQDGSRTMKTLREINVPVTVAHALCPVCQRNIILHGLPKPL